MIPDLQHVPRVAVDCDPGLDDAIALLAVVALHRAGSIRLELVTTVAGNGPLVNTSANARYVLDAVGMEDVPVCPGAASPLEGAGSRLDGSAFHGSDSLGGLYPPGHRQPSYDCLAAERLADWAQADGGESERWLLCTGPLTNVATALRTTPGLPGLIKRVVVMGGAFGSPSGNITPWAEFNFHADPQAAAVVCRSTLRIELIPLDVTERVEIRPKHLTALGKSTLPRQLLLASIDYTRQAIGLNGCYVHDAIAALVMARPDLALSRPAKFSVNTNREAEGHVTEYLGPSTATRAVQVDAERTRQLLIDLLHRVR